MNNRLRLLLQSPVPPVVRWLCYAGDVLLLGLAAWLALQETVPLGFGRILAVTACVVVAGALGLFPYGREFKETQPFAGSGGQRGATAPRPEQRGAVTAPEDDLPDQRLVEIALLAWRIQKRAAGQPDGHRSVVRNAEKIVELLQTFGVEVVSYAGRKLDLGSRVNVLEWIEGEENRVCEEHEPQIQLRGRVAHQALVTAGKGAGAARVEQPS